ncbi:MAG TPA: FixH family protein [Polyangiaceae bacterium]
MLPAPAAHAASTDLTVSATKIAGAPGALARRFRLYLEDTMDSLFSRSIACAFSVALVVACTSKTPSGPAGGAVPGAADAHCGTTKVTVNQASCNKPTGDAGAGDAATADAMPTDDAGMSGAFGATMYNQSGADDDCKYDLSWTSTPVYGDTDVTFTVTVKARADGKPALGADPNAEVFLDDTHGAPNAGTKTTDKGNGVYDVGPIRFDQAGKWTVRFHLFGMCMDTPDSPHGHAAFYVNVNFPSM